MHDLYKSRWWGYARLGPGFMELQNLIIPPFFDKSKYRYTSEFNKTWADFSSILVCFYEKHDAILQWAPSKSTFRDWAGQVEKMCADFPTPQGAGNFREDCFRLYIQHSAWIQLQVICTMILTAGDINDRLTNNQINTLKHIAKMAPERAQEIEQEAQNFYNKRTFIPRDGADPDMQHNNKIIAQLIKKNEHFFTALNQFNKNKEKNII